MMVVVKMLLTMMKLVMRIVMNIGDGDDAGDLAEDDDAITPEVPVLCYQDLDPLGPDTKTLASNPETVEGFDLGVRISIFVLVLRASRLGYGGHGLGLRIIGF